MDSDFPVQMAGERLGFSPMKIRAGLEDGSLRELRLILDVPQVNRSEEPFDQLCRVALELASAMDADLVDDVGQPLNPELLAQIGVELNSLYDALDERDLSAGSDLARRLFS